MVGKKKKSILWQVKTEMSVSIHKVVLEHSHTHWFTCLHWCYSCRFNTCDRLRCAQSWKCLLSLPSQKFSVRPTPCWPRVFRVVDRDGMNPKQRNHPLLWQWLRKKDGINLGAVKWEVSKDTQQGSPVWNGKLIPLQGPTLAIPSA